jgi:hypothetical protein
MVVPIELEFEPFAKADCSNSVFARHRGTSLVVARVGCNGTNQNLMVFKANTSRFTD